MPTPKAIVNLLYLVSTNDLEEAMEAMKLLSQTEGIIPAIETAHALAGIPHLAKILPTGASVLVNLSGRGDKDMETAGRYFGLLGA